MNWLLLGMVAYLAIQMAIGLDQLPDRTYQRQHRRLFVSLQREEVRLMATRHDQAVPSGQREDVAERRRKRIASQQLPLLDSLTEHAVQSHLPRRLVRPRWYGIRLRSAAT